MRVGLAIVCMLCLLAPALRVLAEEPPSAARALPGGGPDLPAALRLHVEAVLAAVSATDDAALRALAEKDDPDPWVVVDLLLRRRAHAAAVAYAGAAPRVDVEELPAYVEAQRGAADDSERWARLGGALAALQAREHGRTLQILGDAPPGALRDVLNIELESLRARALLGQGASADGAVAMRRAARGAAALGWLSRAEALGQDACEAWLRAGPVAEALEEARRLLDLAQRRGLRGSMVAARNSMGRAQRAAGALDEAAREFEQALALLPPDAAGRDMLALTVNLGNVHQDLGDLGRALELQERGLETARRLGDARAEGIALGNVGNALFAQGHVLKSLDAQQRAAQLLQSQGDSLGAARALRNAGVARLNLGDYPRALANLERAREICREGGDLAGLALTL